MRGKRTIAVVLSAILTLCLTMLPRGAMAVSNVSIGGGALTSSTPYYKDGATSSGDPAGGWTAYFTGDKLQLRNLGRTGITDQGINVPTDPTSFPIQLEGNANAFSLFEHSSNSAISGDALVFIGNGSLSVASGTGIDGRYGIDAGSIILQGASLTAAGHLGATSVCVTTADWTQYTIMADSDMAGGNAVSITADEYVTNWRTYHYVSFTAIPQPGPGPAPGGDSSGDVGMDVPKTGDSTPLALLCGLVLLAGAGLTVSAIGKRRAAKRR